MKRKSAPPLYDVIRTRAGDRVSPQRDAAGSHRSDGEYMPGHWLAPGRQLQIPVGYVLLAAAGVLLLLMVSYMVGHSQGKNVGRMVYEEQMGGSHLVGNEARVARDPLESTTTPSAANTRPPRTAQPSSGTSQAQNQPPPVIGAERGWGPIESDPRQAGMNYFVLAATTPDGAMRLAEYCRERGLETYVVSGNNSRLRRVIALPGFEAGDRNSPATRAVENLIHSIGDTWKRQEPGASDLRDAYPERYRR
jgi:hypothetical protein